MNRHFAIAGSILLFAPGSAGSASLDETDARLRQTFSSTILPFLESYCLDCHGGDKPKADLDFRSYQTVNDVVMDYQRWELVQEKLEATEMPPKKAKSHPTAEEQSSVIAWLRTLRHVEAQRNAGDPGPVLARRLSNAEYDYTIRDLTGVDIRPAREFPVDPANEAGFDNSGESLTMSPELLKKYLAAARDVADHLVLNLEGIGFASHPMIAETDRDQYCVQRIVDFYDRHEVDYADYFRAAWQFKHRAILGQPDLSLELLANLQGLSPRYLTTLWNVLNEPAPGSGPDPLHGLQSLWRQLPDATVPPVSSIPETVLTGCERLRDFIAQTRTGLKSPEESIGVRGISDGSQPLVLWRNRQHAAHRRLFPGVAEPLSSDQSESWRRFCDVFPDAFFVSKRGHYADSKLGANVRLLSAGFHLMQGYFRDDQPLYDLVLDEAERREIDRLWQELNFITLAPLRQYRDFIFFERAEPPRFMQGAEFDFARSEDKEVTSAAMIQRLAEAYQAKARQHGASESALEAMEHYYTNISAEIRWVENTRREAEPRHLAALETFAERANRRPLNLEERRDLAVFYQTLRREGLEHEEAVRDLLVSVLMSPHFCFHVAVAAAGDNAGGPLSDYSLASRLSYFLWSSLPDVELLNHATAGDLHQPAVLVGQTRRMLQDGRARGLAVEFGGQWLDFRRFEEHNAVDREHFPNFTRDLQVAMFEEPVRFFLDLIQRNGSVLEFLEADYSFVNPILARHYGMPFPSDQPGEWKRVDHARAFDRGGLLPMAVFLTKNAPGLRTSPVKRGYWVVRRLLGEKIPPPPPNVPELPADESKTGDLTLPEMLARHRADPNCAGCHDRFDAIGLAFEGYGPVGERREVDLAGRPVQDHAVYPNGLHGDGFAGLRQYLQEARRDDFVDNLCRKLLIYALGRGLLISDDGLLQNMKTRLAAEDHRFQILIETIVTSPQFMNKRAAHP